MNENIQKYRFLSKYLPNSSKRRIAVLTGARQTGKTTLGKKLYPELAYINLDAPENRETLKSLSTAGWAKSVGNAILDEAQKAPVVFEKVKYAFDEGGINFTLLTGSSQIQLLKNIRESLAGRAFFYELWPLIQSEINLAETAEKIKKPIIYLLFSGNPLDRVLNDVPSALLENKDIFYKEAEEYILTWGGMPALLTLSPGERWEWLKNYNYTYLERDLGDLARLDDLSPFRKFQRLSALRSATLLNYSELARDAGISVDSAKRYLEYLKLSYQTFTLQPYYRNITSSVIKTPKIYWVDIGILRQLTGFKGEVTGEIYETMVVSEFFKWFRTNQIEAEMFFYRTRSGMELDLLIETTDGIIGVEIKSRQTVVNKDLRAMREIARHVGNRWKGGMVVYRGNQIKQIDNANIWQVPSRRLFQAPM